jgi:hypothetical protein
MDWLKGNLQEHPMIFMGKSMVSGVDFPSHQSIELMKNVYRWRIPLGGCASQE